MSDFAPSADTYATGQDSGHDLGQDLGHESVEPGRARTPRFSLSLVDRGASDRAELERFVASAFRAKHGAAVNTFLPNLLGLRSSQGQLQSVAGFRAAAEDALFLEQYLDGPVEQVLSGHLRQPVRRDEIAEIGNLASTGCRQARYLVSLLPNYLLDRGHTWVVFTATSLVRGILESVGAALIELAPADPARLAGGQSEWGAYYRTDPRVMAGYLPTSTRLSSGRRSRH
jgi:hypothetical protein